MPRHDSNRFKAGPESILTQILDQLEFKSDAVVWFDSLIYEQTM